jgi:Flp pilus assembly protein TadD
MGVSRRRTLQLLAAVLAAGVMPAAQSASLCRQWTDGLDLNAAGAIGREYLGQYPRDPALKEVLALLRTPAETTQGAVRRLREMIREDYIAGRTVNLSGWLLSRTEGCVFARLAMCGR